MALRLNETREEFREFYGKITEQMPKLISDGRVPMSVAGLMQRRLDVREHDSEVKSSYMDNYFGTGDAVIYHPGGNVKIVLDSQYLRDITPKTERRSGALVLTEDVYNALEGEELTKENLEEIEFGSTRAGVKANLIWRILARDQALLNEYTDFIFGEYQGRFAKDRALDDLRIMGVLPDSANGNSPEMRAWHVDWFGDGGSVYSWRDFSSDRGRLVGVALDK